MLVNGSVTHYKRGFDEELKVETWTRINYDKIAFQGGRGSNTNRGYQDANDFDVRIWPSLNTVSISDFSIGDIIVNGKIELDITQQIDLEDYEDYNILAIKDNTKAKVVPHIHVSGK